MRGLSDGRRAPDRGADERGGRGETLEDAVAQLARAVLYNGRDRYQDALAAAEQASEHSADPASSNWGLAELIVAAAAWPAAVLPLSCRKLGMLVLALFLI